MGRVLVVEDEGIVAKDLERRLTVLGYKVCGLASTADEAVRKAEESRPDLVLMDVMLRGPRDGIDAALAIRQRFHTPVIYVTAYGDDKTLARAKGTGPFGYVLKPFDDTDLERAIEIALSRRDVERLLAESEARYRLLAESVSDLISRQTLEGVLQYVSPSCRRLLGYEPDEMLGRAWREFVHPDDQGASEASYKELREGSVDIGTRALRFRRRDGRTVWLEATRHAVRDGKGRLREIVEVSRDVTERLANEAAARRGDMLTSIGKLVSGLAHEIRNPLFAITANLDAFQSEFGQRPEYVDLAVALRRNVYRLDRLVTELVDYGRPHGGDLEPGSLERVLREGIAAVEAIAERQAVSLRLILGAELPPVAIDRRRLAGAFQNVVENAILQSPRGATVEISARVVSDSLGRWIECRVEDAGTGFDVEDLPRVFEPFFSRRRGGTGLGLSIAQRVMEEHRGTVTAGNRDGGGFVVVMRLPVAE